MVQRPPQGGQAQSQRQRYIVGNAPPPMLSALAEQCRLDPEIDLVNVLGPPDQPHGEVARVGQRGGRVVRRLD